MTDLLQTLALYAIPVLLAITLHEAAHGYVARLLGDPTAYQAGRITLNPLKHIDPVGTVLVPLGIFLFSRLFDGPGMLFGWAKPVPVNFGRLRHPKRDMLWVALAGPAANLLMAILWVLALRLSFDSLAQDDVWLLRMAIMGVNINLVLMALNLLPILPLDGGRILVSLLPTRLSWQYAQLEPYGMPLVLLLMASGLLWKLMAPLLALGEEIVSWFW